MAYPSNNGGVAQDQLRSIVERIERLREEIDALNKDVSEVYKEARGNGFDVPTLKALVSERAKAAKDPVAFQEKEALLDIYRHALETGTRNATRVHVREAASLRTDKSVVSPSAPAEATVKGEADGIATGPRTAPPTESLVGQSGLTSPVPDLDTSFAGTEGDADRQPNSKSAAAQDAGLASTVAAAMATEIGRKALTTAIDVMIERLDESENNSIPACSSPPEPGGDAASSSLASSPTNSPAARPFAGEGPHPTDDKERGDAVRGKGLPDGEVHMAVKSPHGAHQFR